MSLWAKKEERRKQMKGVIASISPQQRGEKSRMIVQQLCEFFTQKPVRTLAVFTSLASEPDIRKFVDRAEMKWSRIVFPHTSKTTYTFVSWNAPETRRTESIEVILVPGVAFTAEGKRLGRWWGRYDRVLAHCRILHPNLITIGVCFSEQLVTDIPLWEHDQIMDKMMYA